MKRLTLFAAAIALAAPLFAQAGLGFPSAAIGSNFFAALVCGVIIAFAIQYLLTAISVAAGVSAVPNLKKKYAEVKATDRATDARHGINRAGAADDGNDYDHGGSSAATGVKVSAAVGIWNLVTTAIALFTGAALAMKLVPEFAETPGTATTLALTIWGTFFMLLFWLESRFASTLVGGIISTATSGLKSAAEGVKSLVTPSPASQVESVADATIDKLEASFGGFDTDQLVGAIENFGQRVENAGETVGKQVANATDKVDKQLPSYDKLVADLRGIMNESSSKSGSNPAKWTAVQSMLQTAIESGDESGGEQGKAKSADLKKVLQEFKAEYDKSGDPRAAAEKTASGETDLSEEQIDEYVSKIEETLRTTEGSDFGTGKLGDKLQAIVNHNGVSLASLSERLESLDRDEVTTLLADNTNLTKEKVDTYVEQAVKAITTVREKLAEQSSSESTLLEQARELAPANLSDVDVEEVTAQAKAAIAGFLRTNDTDAGSATAIERRGNNVAIVNEEDALASLKRDLVKAMNNPSDTLDILQNRLRSFDADTVLSMLPVGRADLQAKRNQIERTLNDAKAEVETRANHLQVQAQGALRQAERRAVIEAEHARQTASSAAWWLVLSIVVSGAAAIGGALLS